MLTPTGWGIAASSAVLLAAGFAADYPELVMIGITGAALLLLASLWLLAKPELSVSRQISPERIFEGTEARGRLTVTNTGRRRTPPLAVVEELDGTRSTVWLPDLATGESWETDYPLPTTKRGRYAIPAPIVGHTDPLRLIRRGRAAGVDSTLHVYPQVHELRTVSLGGPQDEEGPTSSLAPQGGVAFHSLREYEPGDDWRLIHWPSSARTGMLVARHTVVPDQPRQLVLLDTSDDRSFEDAVRVAASLTVAAERAGHPVELRTTAGQTITGDMATVLDSLSTVTPSAEDRGTDVLLDVASADQGVALTVITGDPDPTKLESLAMVRGRFLNITVVHFGQPRTAPGLTVIRAESSEDFARQWNNLVLR
ncbi:DUF58 domain-containing protein [Pseudonocardiaceae bacterium YIM PH 21723]|nr:DUF58 domain-containing protein [Pseudonocardiaceae bacterium YIM PH 21723]